MSKPTLDDPAAGDKVRRTIPLGRVGKPEEIAAPVLFLCTEHAGFITGEIFNVNGGAVLVGKALAREILPSTTPFIISCIQQNGGTPHYRCGADIPFGKSRTGLSACEECRKTGGQKLPPSLPKITRPYRQRRKQLQFPVQASHHRLNETFLS